MTASVQSLSLLHTLEAEMKTFQAIEEELQNTTVLKQKRMTQKHENEIVKKEFSFVKDDAVVYKLVGPVLIPQEKSHASSVVERRIEYLDNEIHSLEEQTKKIIEKRNSQRKKISSLQSQLSQKK